MEKLEINEQLQQKIKVIEGKIENYTEKFNMYKNIYDNLASDIQMTVGNKDFVPMLVKNF